MWFWVFLVLLLLLILYVLLIPITIFIDTDQNQYEVQLHGLAKASIEAHQKEIVRIKLKVLGRCFYFYPLKKNKTQPLPKSDKILHAKKKAKKSRNRFGIRKMIAVLRTFTVKRIVLNIDTGDTIQNAKLYSIFGWMNHYIGTFNINFEGQNRLILQIHNRPIYIIKSYINF